MVIISYKKKIFNLKTLSHKKGSRKKKKELKRKIRGLVSPKINKKEEIKKDYTMGK